MSLLFSLNFAASVIGVHGAFLRSATLCAYDMRRDGFPGLARWLERERITVVHTIPTVFRGSARLGSRRASAPPARSTWAARPRSRATSPIPHERRRDPRQPPRASTEVQVIAPNAIPHRGAPPSGPISPAGVPPEGVEVRASPRRRPRTAPGEVGAIVVSSPT